MRVRALIIFIAVALVAALTPVGVADAQEAAAPVDPAGLPPLESDPLLPVTPEDPAGDFADPPPTGAEAPRPGKIIERTETSNTKLNADGTHELRVYSEPVNFQDEDGEWQPIDTTLVAESDGDLTTKSSPVEVTFAEQADADEAVTVSDEDWSIAFGIADASKATARRAGSTVTYRDALGKADVVEEATPDGVKESIILTEAPTGRGDLVYKFPLTLDGVTPKQRGTGPITFENEDGDVVATIPPGSMWDSAELPLPLREHPVTLKLEKRKGDYSVKLTASGTWLRSSMRRYPVTIDPQISAGHGTGMASAFVASNDRDRNFHDRFEAGHYGDFVGNLWFNEPIEFYTFQRFDLSPLQDVEILSAEWRAHMNRRDPENRPVYLHLKGATWNMNTVTWNNMPNHKPGVPAITAMPHFDNHLKADISTWVAKWIDSDNGWANHGFSIDTQGGNYWYNIAGRLEPVATRPMIAITYLPRVAIPQSPVDDSVILDTTPTLTAAPVTDVNGPVQYWFRVSTGKDGMSGQLANSGWINTPSWTVPAGTLQDGVEYHWVVYTKVGGDPDLMSQTSAVRTFRLDLRLGSQPATPMQTAGPVAVNLATGNLTTSVASPSFPTLGGGIGFQYTYNSLAPADMGLMGSYYDKATSSQPMLVRRDSQVEFDWGAGSPAMPMIPNDKFVAKWTGFVTVPETKDYKFGACVDDAVKITVNNTVVLSRLTTNPNTCHIDKTIKLTAGQAVPIVVDYAENDGLAGIKLFYTLTTVAERKSVPSSWLSTSPSVFPRGWRMSIGGGAAPTYRSARLTGDSLVLYGAGDQTVSYRRTGSGASAGWEPVNGGRDIVSTHPGFIDILVHAADGYMYAFDAAGVLKLVQSSADVGKPAAPLYAYNTTNGLLTKVTDPVSSRFITLSYTSDGNAATACAKPPAGFDAIKNAPGMLCKIAYWDGTQTNFFYKGKQLSRIADPGGVTYDFAYDGFGLMRQYQSPLVADAIAMGQITGSSDRNTIIDYDSRGRASSVTSPKQSAEPGADRTKHTFGYGSSTAIVRVEGNSEPRGYTRQVAYDTAGRITRDTNATGQQTLNTWAPGKDLLLSTTNESTDGRAQHSTTIYDPHDRPVESYGPSPRGWFNSERKPHAEHRDEVPRTVTEYDGGLQGLSVMFWKADGPVGNVVQRSISADAQPAGEHWGAGGPAGVAKDHFFVRMTGSIKVETASNQWQFELTHDDGGEVWIDNVPVISKPSTAGTDTSVRLDLAAGWHDIRIDYHENTGLAGFNLRWRNGAGAFTDIPAAQLTPRLDLITKTIGADGEVTETSYANPAFGMPTATTLDPAGLKLRSTTEYETQSASTYFRVLSTTLPSGAKTTMKYYGAGGEPVKMANPCVPGSPLVHQGGRISKTIGVTNSSGNAQTESYVYDAAGRTVAQRVNNDAWSCTKYDARGRVVTQESAAVKNAAGQVTAPARIVTYKYGVDGKANVNSASDSAGTITTTLDWQGNTIRYVDVWGRATGYNYNELGQQVDAWSDTIGIVHTDYDPAGRVKQVQLNGVVVATPGYDAFGRLAGIAYANGTNLTEPQRDHVGRAMSQTWTMPGGAVMAKDQVWYTPGGRVKDQLIDGVDANPAGNNFTYDAVGRLVDAWVPGRHLTYGFGSVSGCGAGAVANAGKNTNRTSSTDTPTGGPTVTTTSCYDAADRMLSTTAPGRGVIEYDDHGNTTRLGDAKLKYDADDRHIETSRATRAALVVVANPAAPTAGELKIKSKLEETKWTVTFADDDGLTIAAATAVQLVIVAPAADSAKVVGVLDAAPVPVLATNNGSMAMLHLSTEQGLETGQTSVMMTGVDTPLSGNLHNAQTVASSPIALQWAKPATTARVAATIGSDASKAVSFGYEEGSLLVGGSKAPARRIGLFLDDASITSMSDFAGWWLFHAAVNWATPTVEYTRDLTGRIVARKENGVTMQRYVFTGPGDEASATIDSRGGALESTVALPGGVTLQVGGGEQKWSYPNLHGDVVATADAAGMKNGGTFNYDPFGNALSGMPDNSAGAADYGWVGKHQKLTEHELGLPVFIQMGARVYDPTTGRFLQTDPIAGGNANDYVYPADPINKFDLTGQSSRIPQSMINLYYWFAAVQARNRAIMTRLAAAWGASDWSSYHPSEANEIVAPPKKKKKSFLGKVGSGIKRAGKAVWENRSTVLAVVGGAICTLGTGGAGAPACIAVTSVAIANSLTEVAVVTHKCGFSAGVTRAAYESAGFAAPGAGGMAEAMYGVSHSMIGDTFDPGGC